MTTPDISTFAYVYFITSNVFKKDQFKLVVTRAAEDEIITAHKDVYCGDDVVPEFTIFGRNLVWDKELFTRYRNALRRKRNSLEAGFYDKGDAAALLKIIETVNALQTLIDDDETLSNLEDRMVFADLVVSEDVAAMDGMIMEGVDEGGALAGWNTSNVNSGLNGSVVENGPQLVPLTRMLELRHVSEKSEMAIFCEEMDDCVAPFYNEYLIFNKGYGFIPEIFSEIFPEFDVLVHDQFPKLELAEEMLWFLSNKLSSGDKRDVTRKVVEKIRVFFDCTAKRDGWQPSDAITNDPFKIPVEYVHEYPLGNEKGSSIPDLRGIPTILKDDGKRSFSFPDYNAQPISLNNNTDPPLFDPLRKTEMLSNASGNMMGSLDFAAPFHMDPSPCRDAFVSGNGTTWMKDTRKEVSPVGGANDEKKMTVRRFVEKRCHNVKGSKVKSSKLLEMFREYYEETKGDGETFEKSGFNQTTFSVFMKQLSIFDTRRERDGKYWVDLHVGRTPPGPPETVKIDKSLLSFNKRTHINPPTVVPVKKEKAKTTAVLSSESGKGKSLTIAELFKG